jgi:aerobic carbon-monoxide dehydrogenase medium subunit
MQPNATGRSAVIPASFTYHRPTSVPETVALLAELGEDARPLAGGHSLIPMMKLRLAVPTHLVDLAAVSDLRGVRQHGAEITVGAMTTQHQLIGSELIAERLPLLRETALVIADPQVRYLGTLGGNVANGDPGNDMPAVMMCLNASYAVAGKGGERRVAAREFYHGAYFTALEPGEIITAIHLPVPPERHGYAYEKLKRKVGDYATAAAAVILTLEGTTVTACSVGLTNVAETPLWAEEAGRIVVGSSLDPATVKRAVTAAQDITAPASDNRGPAAYRTRMAGVMLGRALERAAKRAA